MTGGSLLAFKNKSLSIVKNSKVVCRFFDSSDNFCLKYGERPFICRIYPFVIDLDKVVEDGIARPEKAFLLQNLKIHSECPGYGKGKRVYGNKNLQRKLENLGHDFAIKFKVCFEKEGDVSEII